MKDRFMPLINPDRRSFVTPVLHFYWRITRGMTLGVRACVVDAAGQILLIRHSYTTGWHFPGGGVEVGQSLDEALAMELREEANVELTGPPVLAGMYFNRLASGRDHVALFRVEAWRQPGPFVPTREILEARFFSRAALPEDTTRATRRRIAELFDGAAPSTDW